MSNQKQVLLPKPVLRGRETSPVESVQRPVKKLASGEPIIITFGDFICQLSAQHHVRIGCNELGWSIAVTHPSGGFPVQYVVAKDGKTTVPTRSEAIACAWQLIERQVKLQNPPVQIIDDENLLPDDVKLLKKIIIWQQTKPSPHTANAKANL